MRGLILLFALVGVLAAQEAPDLFAWWDRPIARNLNLTPEQTKQVQSTVREFRDRLIEQRATVQKAEANLRDLMDEEQVNEGRTREGIDRVVAARGELMRSVSLMALRMRTVLTPEQWQRIRRRAVQQVIERRRARGVGAPGGPANPGQARRAPVY
jgi:Spy/CpxP family protein refolding chaperone